jgi:tripartite-type tricarboxylate transporter receptor subunit TctC
MKKLEADVKAVSLDPVIQNKLAGAGLDTFYKTPEQTLSLLSSDIDFYKKMSKIANIKQE